MSDVVICGVVGVALLLVLSMAAWSLAGGRTSADTDADDPRPGTDDQWSTWQAVRTDGQAYAEARSRATHPDHRAERSPSAP
ncbi:MAG: hypothetical protein HOV94_05650 [Saccharothrix sp.]|nr:hypothetical protein [Saccharothrix sp.]